MDKRFAAGLLGGAAGRALLAAGFMFFSGCAGMTVNSLTAEQQEYLARINEVPLDIEIDAAAEKVTWERARKFIEKYSTMRLEVDSETTLKTYMPTEREAGWCAACGYYVAKTKLRAGKFRISVRGFCYDRELVSAGPVATEKVLGARVNALIMADYLRSGEIPHPEMILQ